MKIIVALKQVAARDSALKLDASGQWIDESDLAWEINEADAYALEAALQLKERQGGEAIALCAGPARAAQALREALAKGADRAIHIEEESLPRFDALAVARVLAAAARPEAADLLLTGLQSDDTGAGQTGVLLAELLGLPHASLVVRTEAIGGGLRVKRELEGGWHQFLEMSLPAVLSIQSGAGRLRYATLMGIKKAKTKPLRRVSAAELGVTLEAGVVAGRLYPPERAKRTVMLAGGAREAASALVEKLRFEARVL
ncbi:MAG: electron transfer flavoprotein subunit beta/FixA family protein [Acidobacteria bacterium]|nr:electron transfer flavoprotein subunit beta/FixA family protein [Acidobacteriota bacterium]